MSAPLEKSLSTDQTALLMDAIDYKSVEVVMNQLELGASVDAPCISPDFEYTEPSCDGPYGWRPLQYAVFNHRPEVVACLLQHGADANSCSFKHKKYRALRLAVGNHKGIRESKGYCRGRKREYTQIIRLLLEHGADRCGVANNRIVRKQLAKVRWGKVRGAVRVRPFALHWLEEHAKERYKEPDTNGWQALTRQLGCVA